MGQNKSKEILESEGNKELREIAEKNGPSAVKEYIEKTLNRWKTEKVKIAVTGRSATGKSSFINAIRNVGPDNVGYAESGTGNTTKEPTPYENPENPKIIYYDLPGYSIKFERETYVTDMRLYDYDYFMIFFDKVIGEEDYWVVTKLNELDKKFCLVRSKIDEDIKNAKYDRKKESDVIPEIRAKIKDDVKSRKHDLLKTSEAIFRYFKPR